MKAFDAIAAFNAVRNIPYQTSDDARTSCYDKAVLLKSKLEPLGYSCQLMIGEFDWSDLPLPSSVLSLPHPKPERHVFLRVSSPGWSDQHIDPTVDDALGNTLTVPQWDGKSDTALLANLKRIKLYNPRSPWERVRGLMRKIIKPVNSEEFYLALDGWLQAQRQHK